MNILESRINKTLALVFVILLLGVSGYMLLSNYSFVDALYMTVITITTVGFGEVKPFTPEEKIFTVFLILTSITVFGYAVSTFSEFIVSGRLFEQFKHRKVEKQIKNLKGHTIVCGFGRNGNQAILKLNNYNEKLVVVEKDKEMISELDNNSILNIQGDATLDETLLRAGIKSAANLITALPSDADNLFVVLSARELNSNLTIISRASQGSSVRKLKIAGASNVIMPDSLGGAHMASLVITPDVIEFLDHITIQGDSKINLEEINFENIPEAYKNKTIASISQSFETGCNIVGYKTQEGDFIVNPEPSTLLVPGSKLFVLGKPEQINQINKIFGI